jgi:hypothetical protein
MVQNSEVFHVTAMPTVEPAGELIRQIAAIVSQPEYQIRLLFAGPLPKIIAHYREEGLAAAAVNSLKKLGLTAFRATETELRKPASVKLFAHRLEFGEGRINFKSRGGESMKLEPSDAWLILTGRRAINPKQTENITRMKLNLPATLLTGGVPMMKRVTVEGEKTGRLNEQFIRLYGTQSDVPIIEIRQHDFDYSFLGSQMASTTTINIVSTLKTLSRFFSQAFFDHSLMGGFPPGSRAGAGTDWVEENCRLLYRYYLTIEKPLPPTSSPSAPVS